MIVNDQDFHGGPPGPCGGSRTLSASDAYGYVTLRIVPVREWLPHLLLQTVPPREGAGGTSRGRC